MSTGEVKIEEVKLNKISETLINNKSYLKIGIIGESTRTKSAGKSKTNADIGKKHEFGEDGLPKRSFLRMPLGLRLGPALEDSSLVKDKERFAKEIVENKKLDEIFKAIGLIAEDVIKDAFQSHGFGLWEKSNMERKRTHLTLVETTQLRDSISSEVVNE